MIMIFDLLAFGSDLRFFPNALLVFQVSIAEIDMR